MDNGMDNKIDMINKSINLIEDKIINLKTENEKLKKENEELRRKNDKFFRMLMKTEDSTALPNVYHRAFFGITEILSMDRDSDEEKLDYLKICLRPSIEENPRIVLSCIASIKEELDEDSFILEDFHEWILNTFPY